MRKLILNLVFASLVALIALSAEARVKPETLAGEFFEGRNISIRGKKLDTSVTLTTVDNQTFTLTGTTNKKKTKLTIQLPLISNDAKVRLTFTDKDGAVTVNTVIFNDPTLANGGVDVFSDATVLPESVETGITQGAQGPEGPQGEQGDPGPQGSPGTSPTSLSGSRIIGPVALANEVVFATQNNITTLPSLVSAGTAGTTTAFLGPISAPQGITGDLTGDATNFTAALAGDITGNQGSTVLSQAVLFGKTLPSHTALAGTVATGNTLEVAIEKLDGNSQANATAITAIQGVNTTQTTNISTNATAIGAPTASPTPNEIVKRDGAGSFEGNVITATSFVGPVTGLASSATTSVSFTGPLVGDITGFQGATVLAPSILFAKQLEAGYASTTGAIAANTSLLDAIQILDGNVKDTVQKTGSNATAIGAINASITNIQTDISDNATDIAANTAAAAAAQATADGAATAVVTAQTAADDAQADIDALSTVTPVTLTATSFSATDLSVVVLTSATFALENITDGTAGQRLTIIFADAATVNDLAGNINTDASLLPDADDVLELIYTGTTWVQVSFSAN